MKGYLLTEPGQLWPEGPSSGARGRRGTRRQKMVIFMRVSNSDIGKYFTHLFIYLILSSRFCCFGNLVLGLMISVTVLGYLSLLCCLSKSLRKRIHRKGLDFRGLHRPLKHLVLTAGLQN